LVPGATNLYNGVADAHLDRAPLVAITGRPDCEKTHKEAHQYLNIVQAFQEFTTWNSSVTRADFIPEIVSKAFDIARDMPGATHIELPEDIAAEQTNKMPLVKKPYSHIRMPDEDELQRSAMLIEAADMPVILVGNGVIREDASEELCNFVRNTGIPVVTTFMEKVHSRLMMNFTWDPWVSGTGTISCAVLKELTW
jgi:acetolactate synthase-1/2/3 large subunit